MFSEYKHMMIYKTQRDTVKFVISEWLGFGKFERLLASFTKKKIIVCESFKKYFAIIFPIFLQY